MTGLFASEMPSNTTLLFNPDSVSSFAWETGGLLSNSVSLNLGRATEGGEWTSQGPESSGAAIDSHQIQKALVALAQSTPTQNVFAPFAKIRGQLSLKSGETFRFIWNGTVFKWTDGPLAGKGGLPAEFLRNVLRSGRYLSEKPKFSWCQARPTELKLRGAIGDLIVTADADGGWSRTADDQLKRKIDPTSVEKWLGESCAVDGEFWIDRRLGRDDSSDATFSADSSSWKFNSVTNAVAVDSNRALKTVAFVEHLRALGRIP